MGIREQYKHHQLHSLKLTASILTHLASNTPAIPGRSNSKLTRLPGIRSLLTIDTAHSIVTTLPPLQCAMGLVHLGTPPAAQSPVFPPTKVVVGSPTSPGMTPASPTCQLDCAPSPFSISPKRRRPLSLHDLLSAETSSSPSIQRSNNAHHRRQCGIDDCHKYALTGGFCIRHGGGKRCSFEGCQTVAQSGGRCKAHGGGSKCKVSGCGSVARRKGFCMTHGGRQQCKIDGCGKCAHGGGFCISHGGGKRCSAKSCHKSAQAGGFCYSHGGGKRCAAPECFQAARKGGLCIRHRKAATLHPSLVRLSSVRERLQDERRLSRLYYCSRAPGRDASHYHGAAVLSDPAGGSRRLGAEKPPPIASLAPWQPEDSPLYWDESDGLSLLPECELEVATACRDVVLDKLRERSGHVVEGEKEKQKEHVEDSLNVDELSELFSCVEQEETSGVDFSVFVNDDDAINVEEISQMFSCEEDKEVTASSLVDVEDMKELEVEHKALDLFQSFNAVAGSQDLDAVKALADVENVDSLSEVISATLEDKDALEPATVSTLTYSVADCEDAKNIDLVADLLTSLEASSDASQEAAADRSATQDWIDALEVDNVVSLFADLEQAEKTKTQMVASTAPVNVDSRVFVPSFSVRIDGQLAGRPAVGPHSNLLVGPPGVLLSGPTPPIRNDCAGRWKPKRKSTTKHQPDPSLSDTRRASAAKRQRVKGRFVSDTNTFVSISALQK